MRLLHLLEALTVNQVLDPEAQSERSPTVYKSLNGKTAEEAVGGVFDRYEALRKTIQGIGVIPISLKVFVTKLIPFDHIANIFRISDLYRKPSP